MTSLCKAVKRSASTLKHLNISDSTFGVNAMLKLSYEIASTKLPKLEFFSTNFNEIESTKAWKACFSQIVEACENLKVQGDQLCIEIRSTGQ